MKIRTWDFVFNTVKLISLKNIGGDRDLLTYFFSLTKIFSLIISYHTNSNSLAIAANPTRNSERVTSFYC